MDSAYWDKLRRLFDQAIALPPEERTAFLGQACADDLALRSDLNSLLDHYEESEDLFDRLGEKVLGKLAEEMLPSKENELLLPETVSHYRIEERLGGGGMGVVYKARDLRLQRTVALKFLPPLLGYDPKVRRRFEQEARAASALDHPNIATIYEIGETEAGQLFIAMAYYEGETLKKKIERGPLPMNEALDYTAQVTRGLAKAHAAGIVHRDVKPANVMVTDDGIVKILDFGVAKIADVSLTGDGARIGTVPYMSPEQTRGDGVDPRTDLWSLGVTLYELLTGERPFKGDYADAIIYSVLHEDPLHLTRLRTDLPDDLEHVVALCLEKDRALRYSCAADLLADLEMITQHLEIQTWGGRLSLSPKRLRQAADKIAIVVLPFKDISPGKDHEYFSDGLTEEIITDLSQIETLSVISRTSAMLLKGTDRSIQSIGRMLNVRYALLGSVRKAGSNLRITAQLIDTRHDMHVWAEKYNGTLDDIFDIQETVSRAIVKALKLTLSPEEEQRISERPFDNVQAYECYLRARQEIYLWTKDALDRAFQHLQNGLDIVGENALLYAGMGYVCWQYVNAGIKPVAYLDRAENYVNKVFDLVPESPYGHRLLGLTSVFRGDFQGAVRHLKRALALAPNDPDSLFWLSVIYGYFGKPARGIPLVERLLVIDPLNPINHGMPGFLHLHQGRFGRALTSYRKMFNMEPENPAHRFAYVQLLAFNGHLDEAYAIIELLIADTPDHPFAWMCSFLKYALQGEKAEALATVTPELEAAASGDPNYSWFLAECYALIDEKEQALDWLEKAIESGFLNYPFLAEFDPFLESIRSEARFQDLMDRVKHTWEHLDV